MPTTRSQTKQSHIEDFVKDDASSSIKVPKKPTTKRTKSSQEQGDPSRPKTNTSPASKRQKSEPSIDQNEEATSVAASTTPAKVKQTNAKSFSKQNAAILRGKDKTTDTKTQSSLAKDEDNNNIQINKEQDITDSPIMINRAPVLALWASTLTQFLYPSLSWETCLSAGNAISALCAVSKGRSIGVIDPKDEDNSDDKKTNKTDKEDDPNELEDIQVMTFHLNIKDGLVILGDNDDKKPANEVAQKKKFAEEEEYLKVKQVFQDALATWEKDNDDDKQELNKKAFGMYEKFRPTVAQGQKGWGRKGQLDLQKVRDVVSKIA